MVEGVVEGLAVPEGHKEDEEPMSTVSVSKMDPRMIHEVIGSSMK